MDRIRSLDQLDALEQAHDLEYAHDFDDTQNPLQVTAAGVLDVFVPRQALLPVTNSDQQRFIGESKIPLQNKQAVPLR